MTRTLRLLALPVAAALGLALAVAAPAAAASPGHARRIGTVGFADPGFAKFGSRYYVYRTGTGFGARSSTHPASGYGAVHNSMATRPAWVSASNPLLWAPDVFATKDSKGTLYVMYFTGQSAARGVHCIGIATSRKPASGFVAQKTAAICSPYVSKGYEAIDPSHYLAKDGKRYLIFKSDYRNASGFEIRAAQTNATGTKVVGSSKVKISSATRIEAPSVISHGGKVWLFTSRGDYANCTYSTDAWSASTFWNGTFTRVRTVMSQKSTGLCGPGGATVIQDGSTTRIAFHAYPTTAHNSARQTWVGVLTWNSKGAPVLY